MMMVDAALPNDSGDATHLPALLATRLAIPPARADLVARPRLTGQLGAGEAGKLTLITAPAGSGKTTLLVECLATHNISNVAWLTLDAGDNDPTRFWAYVIAALDRCAPGVGDHALALLQSPQLPPIETTLTALINALADVTQPITLALDDYHVIAAPAIHAALAFLIDNMPPNLRLIIASRSEPPLPLARLRVRGQLTELTALDLRFTTAEIAEFLNRVMRLDLSRDDLAVLEDRTEGWVAALHLAALALRSGDSGYGRRAALVQRIGGGHRYIVDYLANEVLRRQPPDVQHFLLHTAILTRMCAELCAEVAGAAEPGAARLTTGAAQALLERLEHANLFVVALDGNRRWYRYHHLFAEFLHERMRQLHPERLAALHRRAAAWYEQRAADDGALAITEAVGHALSGDDPDHAARMIAAIAQTLLPRGETATLLGWLNALPERLVRSQPRLELTWAWALTIAGHFDAVEPHLLVVEETLPAADAQSEAERALSGEIIAIRATVAGMRRDIPRAITLARRALELLPAANTFVRGVVTLILGMAHYLSGEMDAASQAFTAARDISQAADNVISVLFALRQLGEICIKQGRLHAAHQIYEEALRFVAERYPPRAAYGVRRLPVAGMALVGLGLTHYEWNDLAEAERLLTEGVELSRLDENIENLLMGSITLARTRHLRGDPAAAQTTLQRALHVAQDAGVPRLVDWMAVEQARLALLQGDVAAAVRWSQTRGLSIHDAFTYMVEIDYLTLAQTLLATGRPGDAVQLLERLLDAATAHGRIGNAIEALATLALALHAHSQSARALTTLEHALTLAAPEGYMRTFLDLGPPLALRLREVLARLHRAPARDAGLIAYIQQLLAAFPAAAATPALADSAAPIEPLSEREHEVLRLIAAGLSNQEIAARLVVGLSTVKKHVNHIYAKLGATSRTQALVRARELGWL